jgi:hypothetical protein
MKKYLYAVGLISAQILSCPLYAEEAPAPASGAQAKAVWQALSAQQKDQAKTQAKATAQEKVQAFQHLSPEQRQQKRTEFATTFRARRAAR